MRTVQILAIFVGFCLGTLILISAFMLSIDPVLFSGNVVVSDGSACSPLDSPIGRILILLSILIFLLTALAAVLLGQRKKSQN